MTRLTSGQQYITPIPMLEGKVVFHIAPHTPLVDIQSYRIANAIKTGSKLYLESQPDERLMLDRWVDELCVLLQLTPDIHFLYGEHEAVPNSVKAFQDFWEVVQAQFNDIAVFEYRCEHVSNTLMTLWNAAYQRGQLPLVQPESKPGDGLDAARKGSVSRPQQPFSLKRKGWRANIRQWAIDFWRPQQGVKEEPDEEDGWGVFWPDDLAMQGFTEWYNSGYRHMPDPYELMRRDPLWNHDMQTLRQIVEHKKPKEDKK